MATTTPKSASVFPYRTFKPEDQLRAVEERIRNEESNHYRQVLDGITTRNQDGARVVTQGVTESEKNLNALYAEQDALKAEVGSDTTTDSTTP